MSRVLITGATGFIGRHCLAHLQARGHEVHATTSRPPVPPPGPNVRWHHCDLLDRRQGASVLGEVRPELLLHLAWYVNPADYKTSPENRRWTQASEAFLREFAERGGRRVVVSGTCFEYEAGSGPAEESRTPLRPATPYAEAKFALYRRLGEILPAPSWAWARIFYLYGPFEPPSRLVASAVRSLLQDRPALCTGGEQVRDFLYVDDVASALVTLLESDVCNAVNVGSGQPISIRILLQALGEKLNKTDLIRLGAIATPPLDPAFLVADVRRLSQEVGWRPQFDLSSGLDRTIAWWRRRLAHSQGRECVEP